MNLNGSTGLSADADAAHPPAIAVPEPLALPVARTIRATGIAGAVVAVTGAVIAVGAVVRVRDRAANNGAAEQSEADARTPTAAPPGMRRGRRRNGQRGDRNERHQRLLHGSPFLNECQEG